MLKQTMKNALERIAIRADHLTDGNGTEVSKEEVFILGKIAYDAMSSNENIVFNFAWFIFGVIVGCVIGKII